MYAITRSLIRSPALRQGLQMANATAATRQVTMKVVPAAAEKVETYDERNERLGRHLSPHLTIYKPQLTSMLSITHRGTGLAVGALTWAIGLGALISSQDVTHYVTMIEGLHLSAATVTALKVFLAFPLAYHTCNGIRHLSWDTGRFLKIKEVYTTGYAMVVASIILTVALAMM